MSFFSRHSSELSITDGGFYLVSMVYLSRDVNFRTYCVFTPKRHATGFATGRRNDCLGMILVSKVGLFYTYPDVVGELFCCSKSHENQLFGDQIQSKFVRLNADFRLVLSSPTTSIPNVGQVARAVFHGRRGELRQKYQEGQEDQLGALGLVVNMIVLWNTLYMGKVIEHLRASGMAVREEDVKRLTPLWYDHIRLTGRYEFTLTAKPEVGGLRPLQQKRR